MFDVHYDYNPPDPFAHMFDPAYGGKTSGEIAFVDAHIGNLLAAIDALGLARNTIVAVTARRTRS